MPARLVKLSVVGARQINSNDAANWAAVKKGGGLCVY